MFLINTRKIDQNFQFDIISLSRFMRYRTLTHEIWGSKRKILSPAQNESFPDVFTITLVSKIQDQFTWGLSFHDDKKFSLRYFIVELMVIVSRDVQLLTDTKINGLGHMCYVTFYIPFNTWNLLYLPKFIFLIDFIMNCKNFDNSSVQCCSNRKEFEL